MCASGGTTGCQVDSVADNLTRLRQRILLPAALRSLENREGNNALFSDPLAELLAGRDAVRNAESYAKVRRPRGRKPSVLST